MSNPFSKESKKFSILTPIYKQTYKTLGKFFNALDEQDYKEFEVIVIFDGPNKQGVKELKKQMDKHPAMEIRYNVVKHGGAPWARNKAFEISTGDYILNLDPDTYLYPETLTIWANEFEQRPDKDVIWGFYEIEMDEGQRGTIPFGGNVPVDQKGIFDYYAMRSTNFITGSSPVRREAYLGWSEDVKSLQDWDMWVRMLKKDDFKGERFHFMARPFFLTEPVRKSGISADSAKNWIERRKYVLQRNGMEIKDIAVCSLGAPLHALHVAKKLDADWYVMPSFKPHEYKAVYLLGFYPEGAQGHAQVFENGPKGMKRIVHWIGTDIFQMQWKVPFKVMNGLKEAFKKDKFIMLTEAKHTHAEMEEMGIESQIIPIPPKEIFEPMPLPEEFSVAVYENPTQKMYHEELCMQIARLLPDIKFYFFGDDTRKGKSKKEPANVEHLGWIDLKEWMPKFSCNLRLTVHDGLPLTPVQFLTAGRHVVTNVPDMKYTVHVDPKNKKETLEAIRALKNKQVDKKASVYYTKTMDFKKYAKKIRSLI